MPSSGHVRSSHAHIVGALRVNAGLPELADNVEPALISGTKSSKGLSEPHPASFESYTPTQQATLCCTKPICDAHLLVCCLVGSRRREGSANLLAVLYRRLRRRLRHAHLWSRADDAKQTLRRYSESAKQSPGFQRKPLTKASLQLKVLQALEVTKREMEVPEPPDQAHALEHKVGAIPCRAPTRSSNPQAPLSLTYALRWSRLSAARFGMLLLKWRLLLRPVPAVKRKVERHAVSSFGATRRCDQCSVAHTYTARQWHRRSARGASRLQSRSNVPNVTATLWCEGKSSRCYSGFSEWF